MSEDMKKKLIEAYKSRREGLADDLFCAMRIGMFTGTRSPEPHPGLCMDLACPAHPATEEWISKMQDKIYYLEEKEFELDGLFQDFHLVDPVRSWIPTIESLKTKLEEDHYFMALEKIQPTDYVDDWGEYDDPGPLPELGARPTPEERMKWHIHAMSRTMWMEKQHEKYKEQLDDLKS